MMACWINRNNGYGLISDSGRLVGEIELVGNRIHGRNVKRLYEPTEWFRIDGHSFIGKPPDISGKESA